MTAQTLDAFQVIADPSRRQMLKLLSKDSMTINALAENFDMSRPAISQHIKVLMECGLITIQQQGRERFCEPRLERLGEVAEWVEPYQKFWAGRLNKIDQLLTQLQAPSISRVSRLKTKVISKKK